MSKHKIQDIQGHSLVTATCLLAFPSSMTSRTSSGLDTNLSVQPWGQEVGVSNVHLAQ